MSKRTKRKPKQTGIQEKPVLMEVCGMNENTVITALLRFGVLSISARIAAVVGVVIWIYWRAS